MKWYKNPTIVFIFLLSIFTAVVIWRNFSHEVLIHLCTIFLSGIPIWWGFKKIFKSKKPILDTIISLLIVFLILNPAFEISPESIGTVAASVILVMGLKFFPLYKRQVLINPAAGGLLVSSICITALYSPDFPPVFVSWWGSGFGIVSAGLLLPIIFWSTWKFRKFYLVIPFILGNFALLYFLEPLETLKFIATDGTIYFFAAIMLAEPKTSPIKNSHQFFAAIISLIVYRYGSHIGIANIELWTILSVNFVSFFSRHISKIILR